MLLAAHAACKRGRGVAADDVAKMGTTDRLAGPQGIVRIVNSRATGLRCAPGRRARASGGSCAPPASPPKGPRTRAALSQSACIRPLELLRSRKRPVLVRTWAHRAQRPPPCSPLPLHWQMERNAVRTSEPRTACSGGAPRPCAGGSHLASVDGTQLWPYCDLFGQPTHACKLRKCWVGAETGERARPGTVTVPPGTVPTAPASPGSLLSLRSAHSLTGEGCEWCVVVHGSCLPTLFVPPCPGMGESRLKATTTATSCSQWCSQQSSQKCRV